MRSNCSCIKGSEGFNFTIDYRGDYILFTDYSEWVTNPNNTPSTHYDIIIKNEEANLETKVTVGVGITTPIHTSVLQSSQECKSDGIYKILVDSCGLKLERTEAIIPSLQCAYTNLLLKGCKTDKEKADLQKVFFELEYIKSAAKVGLTDQASEHFSVLTKILKNLNCSC